MENLNYVVFDLETTGLHPKMGDKITEISIITMDESGQIQEEYETLVNPKRDMGPTQLHGITADMVKNAPAFEEIYETIIAYLNLGVPVAHNANFDLRFLNYELNRLDNELQVNRGLCTLNFSRNVVPSIPSRKLETLCDYFDIELNEAHAAYYDCFATAQLFNILKEEYLAIGDLYEFQSRFLEPNYFEAPNYPAAPIKKDSFTRTDAKTNRKKEHGRLDTILSRLPESAISADINEQEYLNLLDKALSDRIITSNEADQLFELAREQGIDHEKAYELHNKYFTQLTRLYLRDAYLSDSELKDLNLVGQLLGIKKDDQAQIISQEKDDLKKEDEPVNTTELENKAVCFTGQLQSFLNGELISRSKAQALAMEKGMVIKKGVSKKLDYLVTADPHSQSGKAKKAREAGVEIIAEPVFWQMLGVSVD